MKRIDEPSIAWDDKGNPVSTGFDDVYYNRKSGLEETRLVYLGGNNLPENWLNKPNFVIAETGFGTGLNFLATWQMFDETAVNGERLDFISVEKFPLHKDDLAKALHPWRELLGNERIDRFLQIYPPRIPGFHRRWVTDRITLTVIFDDVLRGYQQLQASIDAWFLDGFAPKKNAEMWQPKFYQEMARLSPTQKRLCV
jgi:tRNA 5-methylaminomethyl-2-thiouridine biosynthesis bifunctional protein